MCEMFVIKHGFRKGDVFIFASDYGIMKDKPNQDGLKLNDAHQLLVYADDNNILGESLHTIKKNTETLVVASKETGVEVNVVKTKYVVMF